MNYTIKTYIDAVKNGKIFIADFVHEAFIKIRNSSLGAFINLEKQRVEDNYSFAGKQRLAGVPIAVKDNFLLKGTISTSGSKIMENYNAPYSSTALQHLLDAGAIVLGKTAMDEFAMGSSTESCYYGKCLNPHGKDRVPGGSSGGSAAAVAAGLVVAALGSDTGGSVRQPASLCGVVGFKPTYGTFSRYGVQSMASSLDQIGTFTKTVEDAVVLTDIMAQKDPRDATSKNHPDKKSRFQSLSDYDLKGKKVALPREFMGEGLADNVRQKIEETIEILKQNGVEVDIVDLPLLKYAVSAYYVIMPAESSTNLSRFDGLRFGLQDDSSGNSIFDYYKNIRSSGFGEEVQRRILLGTYILGSENYESYFLKAQTYRKHLKASFDKVFAGYDLIIGPTSPTVAWKIGEKVDDPVAMYLADIYTIVANLLGLPAMSLPVGFVDENGESLPVGFQMMANNRKESNIFGFANQLEQILKKSS